MRALCALSVMIGWAGAAYAGCLSDEQTFMACKIADSGKSLRVCFDDDTVHYRFGAADQSPELALSVAMVEAVYQPWPGIGRAIWESVAFPNADYTYEVFAGFDRMVEGDEDESAGFGGVHVMRNDQIVGELRCAPESLDFTWGEGLFAAKEAAGMTFDLESQTWGVRSGE